MRIVKKIAIFILSIIVILIVSLFFYKQHLKPTYKGNLKLKNISEKVEVFYDSIGVPHIYAQNQKDAYVALGYVHAQDRLWQMELVRRIASGRLSELFGKQKNGVSFLDKDKFFLTLGITDKAKETIKLLDTTTQSYKLTKAYLDGINQFIDQGPTPLEFTLIGVEKEKYELLDVYNVMGYMAFSFANAHKTDPLLTNIKAKLDKTYLDELDIKVDTSATLIPSYPEGQIYTDNLVTSIDKIMDGLPIPPFIGSNAWVVGSSKTLSNKVILTNDPHIGFSQPSVWYQAHIVCPDHEMYGFNLALYPFPHLGHNRNYAYGLTMFENDDIDFYREEVNPNNKDEYLRQGEYVPFEIRQEVIKIKGGTTELFNVKVSKHGPIMNDFLVLDDKTQPIAMDWVYTKLDDEVLEGSYKLSHATNLAEFKEGVKKIHAPGLNVMYGDAKDNIAWFAAGKLYEHDNNVSTKFILDGTNDGMLTYLNFEQNPQAVNPPEGYVYSANNQTDQIAGNYYPGYYLPEDRAKRIVNNLDKASNITIDDMKNLVNDVTSSALPDVIPEILANINLKTLKGNEILAYKILRNWDYSFELNQVAPTIYTKFKYEFIKNTFKDELGAQYFEQFLSTNLFLRQYSKQILRKTSVWSDDVNTKNIIENKQYNIIKSFRETVKFLENQHGNLINKWTWDKVHTVEYKHPIGDALSFLNINFNVGPFPTSGSNEVLNNQMFDINGTGLYNVDSGPSTRRIIDFSNVENSLAIIPTGQSGNVFSKHYKNQAQHYLDGKFFKMLLNKGVIQKSVDKLVISPK